MLTLVGFAVSNYYNKVKIALLEKGVPFEEALNWATKDDATLAEDFLALLHQTRADYTHTFRQLHPTTDPSDPALAAWHQRWTTRLTRQPQPATEVTHRMHAHNPAVIPRNHAVEAALTAATAHDLAPVQSLLPALANPYAEPGHSRLDSPPAGTPRCRTFCGT